MGGLHRTHRRGSQPKPSAEVPVCRNVTQTRELTQCLPKKAASEHRPGGPRSTVLGKRNASEGPRAEAAFSGSRLREGDTGWAGCAEPPRATSEVGRSPALEGSAGVTLPFPLKRPLWKLTHVQRQHPASSLEHLAPSSSHFYGPQKRGSGKNVNGWRFEE